MVLVDKSNKERKSVVWAEMKEMIEYLSTVKHKIQYNTLHWPPKLAIANFNWVILQMDEVLDWTNPSFSICCLDCDGSDVSVSSF